MSLPGNAKAQAFILTRDRAVSLPFYTEILGLRLIGQDVWAATLDAHGTELRLTTVQDHVASAHTVFGWEVDDLDAVLAGLEARGVRGTVYEGFGQDARGIWTAPDGRVRLVWFPDPEGNVLSLQQHAAG
jgi:catechol 2,3-dioxygenase-like lactoylglutathione lyase family enzyme